MQIFLKNIQTQLILLCSGNNEKCMTIKIIYSQIFIDNTVHTIWHFGNVHSKTGDDVNKCNNIYLKHDTLLLTTTEISLKVQNTL